MLTIAHLHWLAGLFEGEGSFCFIKGRKPHPCASIGMTDYDVIQRAATLLQVPKIYTRPVGPRMAKPLYILSLGVRESIGLMMTLYPLLGARRREQIRQAIAMWKIAPRHGSAQRKKSRCPLGHQYDIVTKAGSRSCRTCKNALQRQRWTRLHIVRNPAQQEIVNG